jgi:GntR family transcriptional regulator/MocR family aminotransferase
MLPWKTIISISKESDVPVYLQIVNAIIRQIKTGVIKPSFKMPGTRAMGESLQINRLTVVKAYGELYAQGWFEQVKSAGTFVSDQLPDIAPRKLHQEQEKSSWPEKTGFTFRINKQIHHPASPDRQMIGFHDGPDVRLVPAEILSRGFRGVLSRKSGLHLLSYIEANGRLQVRQAIADYLNSTRGLQLTPENLIITRGAQMAMHLLGNVLFEKGDKLVNADIGFRYAELTFMNCGAVIEKVPVDEDGIDVDALERLCKKKKIRALYLTSHHHYPTTVTLSAPRRMHLLQLAEKYRFIIIEDDYDYEFHYETSPILPIASADRQGMVVYIGSFSKTISPGVRMGFIAAPPDLIYELTKLRMLVDTQGDPLMEQVVAEMLQDGEVRRHMKKSVKIYHERRDFMVEQLRSKLDDVMHFRVPDGGLAVWAEFDKKVKVPELSKALREKGIVLSPGLLHDKSAGRTLNCTRMGYGWMNQQEMENAVEKLRKMVGRM